MSQEYERVFNERARQRLEHEREYLSIINQQVMLLERRDQATAPHVVQHAQPRVDDVQALPEPPSRKKRAAPVMTDDAYILNTSWPPPAKMCFRARSVTRGSTSSRSPSLCGMRAPPIVEMTSAPCLPVRGFLSQDMLCVQSAPDGQGHPVLQHAYPHPCVAEGPERRGSVLQEHRESGAACASVLERWTDAVDGHGNGEPAGRCYIPLAGR